MSVLDALAFVALIAALWIITVVTVATPNRTIPSRKKDDRGRTDDPSAAA